MSDPIRAKVYVAIGEGDPLEVGWYEHGETEKETQENFVTLLRNVADHYESLLPDWLSRSNRLDI